MKTFWRRSFAFLKRDLIESLSYKTSFFFEFFGKIIHLLIFFFISKMFGENIGTYLRPYGGEYFPFVLIGVVFAGYQTSALHSLANAIAREQSHGTLEAIFMTPAKPIHLVLAVGLWDLVFTFLHTLFFLAASVLIFGVDLSSINILATFVMIFWTVVSLLGFGLISAGFLMAFKRGDPVSFILSGMSKLLSGVYFPIQMFPGWVQKIAEWIPFTHALAGLRKAILQGKSLSDLNGEISFLFLVAVIMIPVGLVFFNRMLQHAQKAGTLAFS